MGKALETLETGRSELLGALGAAGVDDMGESRSFAAWWTLVSQSVTSLGRHPTASPSQ